MFLYLDDFMVILICMVRNQILPILLNDGYAKYEYILKYLTLKF